MEALEKLKKKKLTNKLLNETIIKQIGFHKKWLDDKSGYWWEKTQQEKEQAKAAKAAWKKSLKNDETKR